MKYAARAKQAYDQLIEMGGRPSRSFQQPSWNIVYRDGFFWRSNDEGDSETAFRDELVPWRRHYKKEIDHFTKELAHWKEFRKHQQRHVHLDPLETDLDLSNTDAALIKDLTRLSDWKAFEVFQGHAVCDAACWEERCRLRLLEVMEWEVVPGHEQFNEEKRYSAHQAIRNLRRQIYEVQKDLEAAKSQLDWIKGQWPEVVTQVVSSVSKTPELQPLLEAKFRKQTYAAFNAILNLGGRPSHKVSQPDQHLDDIHRLLHWSSETSMYMSELSDWKAFLKWRRWDQGEESPMQQREFRYPTFQSPLDFYANFEKFRQYEYDVALSWVKCWKRVVRWYEEEKKTFELKPEWMNDLAKRAQSRVIDSKQKFADATTRLEKAMQEHTRALTQDGQHLGGYTEMGISQDHLLPSPPCSNSESSRSFLSPSSPSASPSKQSPDTSAPSNPSQSPESLAHDRRSLNKSSSAGKGYRRMKKEHARKHREDMEHINTNQQPLPSFPVPPSQVEIDDDAEMVDVQEDQSPVEGAEEYTTPESEDIVMADFEDSSRPTLSHPSGSRSEPITGNHTSKKVQSGRKIDQKVPGKILKNTGKKPTKKAKTFTEKQTMALLNAASTEDSPKEFPQPRRIERIREKAAAPAIISPSPISSSQHNANHTYPPLRRSERLQGKAAASTIIPSSSTPSSQSIADHTSPSSERKQPPGTLDPVEPLQPSRRRKAKKEMNTLEPPKTSIRKNSKITKPVVEPSRPSRQKALTKQTRDTARHDC